MICLEDQFLSVNRILLLASGVWPYQQSKFARLQFIIFCAILLEAVISQLTVFLTSECTIDLVITVLSTTLLFSSVVVNYISFNNNAETIKDSLAQLQRIYNKLKDETEKAIVEKYGYDGKRFTIAAIMVSVCSLFGIIISLYWTKILDIVTPLNESRTQSLPIMGEYFINQEKHFSLILSYIMVVLFVGTLTVIGTGSTCIVYFHHMCGVFQIARYRIEHSIKTNILQTVNTTNEKLISERIICAIDTHRQAMKLSTTMVSKLETMILTLLIFGVVCLSLNLFRISQIILIGGNNMEWILPFIYVTVIILYMLSSNYLGQIVTDHSNSVFVAAYNIQWYTTPIHIQRLILFLLQRGTKEFTLSVGGLFVGNLRCFATIVNTSVSYFTIIYSTQK